MKMMKTSAPLVFSSVILLLCLAVRRSTAEDPAILPDTQMAAETPFPVGRETRTRGGEGAAGGTGGEERIQEQRLEKTRHGEKSSRELAAALLPQPEALQGTPLGAHQPLRGLNAGRNTPSCALCSPERNLCRIISGIFTRSPLPYGYSLITPVPAGVCNLTITEMKPSKNYFALRRSDGTYILNGNWDIKTAGEYEAGGSTFIYTPGSEEHGERLLAPGPLREPVDFMLISQSPNPGIKYEYRVPLPDYGGANPTGLGLVGGGARLGGRVVPGVSPVPSPGQRRPFQSSPSLPSRNPNYGIQNPGQGSVFPFGGSNTRRPGDTFMPLTPVLQPVVAVGQSSSFNSSSVPLYTINPQSTLGLNQAGTPKRPPFHGVPQSSAFDVSSRTTARLPGVVPRGHPITPIGTSRTGSHSRPWSPSFNSQDRGSASTLPGNPFIPGQPYPRGSEGSITPSGSRRKGLSGQEREGEGVASTEGGGRDGRLRLVQTSSRDKGLSVSARHPLFKATSHPEGQPVKTIAAVTPPTHRTRHHHGSQGTQGRRKVPGKSSEVQAFEPYVQLTQPKTSAPSTTNTTDSAVISRNRSDRNDRHRHRHQQSGEGNGKKRRKDSMLLPIRGRGRFQWAEKGLTPCSRSCGGGNQTAIMSCERKRNKKVVSDRRCAHLPRPEARFVLCNLTPCPAEWMPGTWGSCSVTCGMGVQTRPAACKQVVSPTLTMMVPEGACLSSPSISTSQVCEAGPCSSSSPTWQAGPWTNCSAPCGLGTRSRQVSCTVEGAAVNDDRCSLAARPVREEVCDMGSCATNTWFFSAWFEQCSEPCGAGVQTRRLHCLAGDTQASCPASERPDASRPCTGESGCGGQWFVGAWSECSETCGAGRETRPVLCVLHVQGRWKVVEDSQCRPEERPQDDQECDLELCKPIWYTSEWSQCSASCGAGIMRREVSCLDALQYASPDCDNTTRPDSRRPCHLRDCYDAATRPGLAAAGTGDRVPPDSIPTLTPPEFSFSSEGKEGEEEASSGVTEQSWGTPESDGEVTAAEEDETGTKEEENKDPLAEETVKEEAVIEEEEEEEEATIKQKEKKEENVLVEITGNSLNNLPGRDAQGDESFVGDEEKEDEEKVEEEGVRDEEEDNNRKRKRKKERKKNKDRRVTDGSLSGGRRVPDIYERPVCIDRIKNCHLVFRARLCRLKYYNKLCCRTCTTTT